jgi:hypothetical protein
MPFNPGLPRNTAPVSSAELRDRFNVLNEAITRLPNSPALLSMITSHSAGPVGAVAPLQLRISDPPTQKEVEAILHKLNDLIVALRRA